MKVFYNWFFLYLMLFFISYKSYGYYFYRQSEDYLKIGGAVRLNYSYLDYNQQSKVSYGDLNFELFRLKINASIKDVELVAQYRWYSDYDFPEYAYFKYSHTGFGELQLGLNRVPFGILPYASHGYWESLLYHLGLEDDNDVGIKYKYSDQLWDIRAGFFKNSELATSAHARFSFDIVTDAELQQFNQEKNQFNLRIERAFNQVKIGGSFQYGQLYNSLTNKTGDHSAAAVHLVADIANWNVQLQYGYYDHQAKNPFGVPNDTVQYGAYGTSFSVANEAEFYLLNIAKKINGYGLLDELSCYNDFGVIKPKRRTITSGEKTVQNLLGCSMTSGAVTSYVELITGKNSAFVNGPGIGLIDDSGWNNRVNINIGYYF